MILLRWAGPKVLGGVGAALVLVGGLVGLTTGVEHGSHGLQAALVAGLEVVPITVVWLAPVCCGVGTAMAMAQIVSHGEDVGLAALGLGPRHTGWVALGVGLLVGACAWSTADKVLPHLSPTGAPDAWIWLDEGAYRPEDGLLVRTHGGHITSVEQAVTLDKEVLTSAVQRSRPRTASAHVLAGMDTPPAEVERQGRLARVMACGSMALLGWIPWARRGSVHVGVVLGLGLAAAAVDLGLHSLAAQGQVSASLGAWAVPVALMLLCILTLRR